MLRRRAWVFLTPVGLILVLALLVAACGSPDAEGIELAHVHGLGIDPSTPEVVFVATHFGLYVHDGDGWERRSVDHADHMGFSLASEDVVFRSGHPDVEMLGADPLERTNLGVQRSVDGGQTWERLTDVLDPPVDFHAMAATRTEPPVLLGWDSSGRGTFRSRDGGERWQRLEADGLPEQVLALAATSDGSVVYASTPQGLHRSLDEGERWEALGDEVVGYLAVGEDPDLVYASRGEVVLRSSDGGRSWEPTGPEGAEAIVALTCSPDGRIVLAADHLNAIWRSDDAAATWSAIPPP